MKKRNRLSFVIFSMLFVISLQSFAKGIDGVKINSLVSGKTVEAYNVKHNYSVTHYYAANGVIKQASNVDGKMTGKWSVKGNEFCIKFPTKGFCGPVRKKGEFYRVYCTRCSSDVLEWRTITPGNAKRL